MSKPDPLQTLDQIQGLIYKANNKNKIAHFADALQQEVVCAGTPLARDGEAFFLHFGDVENVEVVGGFSTEKPEEIIPMQRVGGLNVWVGSAKIPRDAEFLYRLRVDGVLRTDPLCKDSTSEEYVLYSVGRMPDAKPMPEREFSRGIEHGVLESFEVYSDYLKAPRRVFVYLPPDYESSRKRYSVLYVQDGHGALQYGQYDRIMDNLLAWREIQPLILCFIPPENRVFDYWFSEYEYAQFITRELVPCIDDRYRTKTDRANRAITGVTMGGRISLYIATNYSEMFSLCIGHSTYLENNSAILERLKKREFAPLRFYFDVGLFPKTIGMVLGEEFGRNVLAVNRELKEILGANELPFVYREWSANNCMLTWSRGMAEALRIFWPAGQAPAVGERIHGGNGMRKRKSAS